MANTVGRQYRVKLIFRSASAEGDADAIDAIADVEDKPHGYTVLVDHRQNRTEIQFDVLAFGLSDALAFANRFATRESAVMPGPVDSAEILSAAEHLDRLGGPEELARIERWIADGSKDASAAP